MTMRTTTLATKASTPTSSGTLDLFMNIFRRELYGKYRGSVLGLMWTLINPLALMAVYTLVFSVLLKAFQIEHYPLFVLSGLLTWVFFQSAA